MEGFEDLYGDAIVKGIELSVSPTFEVIKSYFSDKDTMERTFSYKGKKIIAKRKFTYKGGGGKMFQIKTNYLHVWLDSIHWIETKNGEFKTV